MNRGALQPQTLVKYALLQLPALAVVAALMLLAGQWIEIADWVFWLCLGLWLAKDAALYPLLWRAYAPGDGDDDPLIGATGETLQQLAPEGYVRVRGERWRARLEADQAPVAEGREVLIIERHGLTLTVRAPGEAERFEG